MVDLKPFIIRSLNSLHTLVSLLTAVSYYYCVGVALPSTKLSLHHSYKTCPNSGEYLRPLPVHVVAQLERAVPANACYQT